MTTGAAEGRTYEHPSSEEEIRDIVRACAAERRPLRVIGAGHSEPASIGPASARTLMLDRMRRVSVTGTDGGEPLVEVEAGCHFGKDPYDPTGTSSWSNSLNAFLLSAGYALPDLGGISHQTIGGFLSTGSSGGTTRYGLADAIERIRFVDGTGQVHEVSRTDSISKGRDLFHAVGVSMGLLGVVTKVWFRLEPSFAIAGQQRTRTVAETPIDFFGDKPGAISFQDYLRDTPYTRLLWWPQAGFDRMVVWQAQRMVPPPGFTPKPYEELGRAARLASLAGCLFYTVLGNLEDVTVVPAKLAEFYKQLDDELERDMDPNAPPQSSAPCQRYSVDEVLSYLGRGIREGMKKRAPSGQTVGDLFGGTTILDKLEHHIGKIVGRAIEDVVSDVIVAIVKLSLDAALDNDLAKETARWVNTRLDEVIDGVLNLFVPLDGDKPPQIFQDTWMCGLPMDNQMDDRLWPTVFTELWVPLHRAQAAMARMRDFYAAGGDRKRSFQNTGSFSCEIYGARRNRFWMSPAFDTDVVRFNVFWFGNNAEDPSAAFFPRFWELLKPLEFRPHWGKALPRPAAEYAQYYRSVFPRLDDFLLLRDKLDPSGVFATPYWREHLGF
ncbi:MAG: FAD-binding protein [Polyangiaceae bacterium]|nr:FAD-binding protein [Polyangiaceae bacterium]